MKKVLLIIGIPLFIIVLSVAALLLFVDPNQFKPLIVEQAKKQTGMDLVIEGDIGWNLFPSLGLSLGRTELKSPAGFANEDLLKIDSVSVDVSVMPLLDKELSIGNVSLNGAEIFIHTKKDGSSNLDSLTNKASATEDQATETDETSQEATIQVAAEQGEAQQWVVNLEGVSITNALLELQDDSTGSYTKLYDVGLSVSEFAFDQWTMVTFAAKGQNNQQKFTAEGQAELKLSQDLATYQLQNIVLDSTFNNPTTDITSAKIELATFAFDKVNPLKLTVQGNAADLDIDLTLDSDLFVDQAMTNIRLDNMVLDSTFTGDTLPQSPMKVTAQSEFGFDVTDALISLQLQKLALNDIELKGDTSIKLDDIPKIRFTLSSDNIDLDSFLGLDQEAPAEQKSGQASTSANSASPTQEVEPDLTALSTLDVKGKIAIDKFKAGNATMQNVATEFTINRGVVDLNAFSSDLYQGTVTATAQLDARKTPATYWAKKQIKGVEVQPLIKDVADNDMLEGTGNISVDIKGKSLTPTLLKQNLAGTVNINFADGAVNGINIAQIIRVNYAKFKGQTVDESIEEEQKTDFSAMTATLHLSKGEMTTDDVTISSPLLRIHGEGKVNYIKETMDMLLDTSIVGTLQGQGGKDIDDLKDITIPVRVYNKWLDPKYKIELDQLWKKLEQEKKQELQEKAEKELDKLLGDKIKDDKAKDLLKSLFN